MTSRLLVYPLAFDCIIITNNNNTPAPSFFRLSARYCRVCVYSLASALTTTKPYHFRPSSAPSAVSLSIFLRACLVAYNVMVSRVRSAILISHATRHSYCPPVTRCALAPLRASEIRIPCLRVPCTLQYDRHTEYARHSPLMRSHSRLMFGRTCRGLACRPDVQPRHRKLIGP